MNSQDRKRFEELRRKYGVVIKSRYATDEQKLAALEELDKKATQD